MLSRTQDRICRTIFYSALVLSMLTIFSTPSTSQDLNYNWYQTTPPMSVPHDLDSKHWYPTECCNRNDCFEVADEEIKYNAAANGWEVIATGEVFAFGSERKSGDGKKHRCALSGDKSKPTLTRGTPPRPCLFLPAPSF